MTNRLITLNLSEPPLACFSPAMARPSPHPTPPPQTLRPWITVKAYVTALCQKVMMLWNWHCPSTPIPCQLGKLRGLNPTPIQIPPNFKKMENKKKKPQHIILELVTVPIIAKANDGDLSISLWLVPLIWNRGCYLHNKELFTQTSRMELKAPNMTQSWTSENINLYK